MSRRLFRLPEGDPLLNIVSYGRGGHHDNGRRLTPDQIDHIRRTVQRAPEVVVKVLARASNDLKAAGKHLDYIGRNGTLPLELDDGERTEGRCGHALLEGWDLDIDDVRRQGGLTSTSERKPPKLVHKLMFSMPAGTPPDKVLAAVRNFALHEFYGQHRYAFVLHTDEDHPHVHFVLKAVSEEGARLNIRKATLRHWRSEFARNLRLVGVPANATERAVRGESRKAKKDGIYRASLRGDSTHMRTQAEVVAAEIFKGIHPVDVGRRKLIETRRAVIGGWRAASNLLAKGAHHDLAEGIGRFVELLPSVQTDRDWIRDQLGAQMRKPSQAPRIPSDHEQPGQKSLIEREM